MVFILTTFAGCSFVRSGNTYRKMTKLLLAKDYFGLEAALKNSGADLSEANRLYFRAHLESAFNQTEQSLLTIGTLFSKHKKSLDNMAIHNLLLVKYNNYLRQFEYDQMTKTRYALLENLPNVKLDNSDKEALKTALRGYGLLESVPPQKIFHPTGADAIIPVKKDNFENLTIQATCNGVTETFILDTGATLSAISESVAKRMGIRFLDGSQRMITVASELDVKLGVADSLVIGDLLFENVVFAIFPDENLTFPQFNYNIRGIIGFPLMNQMKELRINHRSRNIVVPRTPVKQELHNLFWDGAYPIVRLESGLDTLLFMLDTGAIQSRFFKKYFDTHRKSIVEKGQHAITIVNDLAGSTPRETYELKDVPFKIDDFKITLPRIKVFTKDHENNKYYDGTIGQDVLMHSDEMILNFESMYLTLRNKKEQSNISIKSK
jgi:predicted aspartyl protease